MWLTSMLAGLQMQHCLLKAPTLYARHSRHALKRRVHIKSSIMLVHNSPADMVQAEVRFAHLARFAHAATHVKCSATCCTLLYAKTGWFRLVGIDALDHCLPDMMCPCSAGRSHLLAAEGVKLCGAFGPPCAVHSGHEHPPPHGACQHAPYPSGGTTSTCHCMLLSSCMFCGTEAAL